MPHSPGFPPSLWLLFNLFCQYLLISLIPQCSPELSAWLSFLFFFFGFLFFSVDTPSLADLIYFHGFKYYLDTDHSQVCISGQNLCPALQTHVSKYSLDISKRRSARYLNLQTPKPALPVVFSSLVNGISIL